MIDANAPETPLDAASEAAPDGAACADLTGAYSLTGTCSDPSFSPFRSACVTQTGCNATIVVSVGALSGVVKGDSLEFNTTIGGAPLACTAKLASDSLSVHCEAAGGAVTCDAKGTRAAFPGATRYCCDVVTQDCGAVRRCNIVSDTPANANLLTACVARGTLAETAACTRAGGRVGADECGSKLFCANTGQASAHARICQPLCRHSGDCSKSEGCFALSSAPRAGVCAPSCALRGTDCPTGTTCRNANT